MRLQKDVRQARKWIPAPLSGAGTGCGGNEKLAICYKLAEIDDYTWGIIE